MSYWDMFTASFLMNASARGYEMPGDILHSLVDLIIPGGFGAWAGKAEKDPWAPHRNEQIAAVEQLRNPNLPIFVRAQHGMEAVSSVPFVVAEGLTVAPGGRSSERFGEKLYEISQAQNAEDVFFSGVEAGGEFVNAFNAFGAPFAPLSSRRSSIPALETEIVAESSTTPGGRVVRVEAPIHINTPNSGVLEAEGFRLAKHGEMPIPRAGMESHHGVLSRWMEEHYRGYNPDKGPAVLMAKEAHDATRAVYNRWRAEMKKQMGGTFDWSRVSEADIRALGEKMFEASRTPQQIQRGYWQWFDRMKAALERQQATN
jgi:hypothetical protein